jgi:hypothetical protein
MFDFQKEVIINSPDIDGLQRVSLANYSVNESNETVKTIVKEIKDDTVLSVLRCADYEISKITEITKTAGQKGVPAALTVVAPTGAKGNTVHAEIVIGLEGKYAADYANVWSNFGKSVIVEYAAVTGDAAELAKKIAKALPADNEFIKVDGTTIKLTDSHQIVKKAEAYVITKNETTGVETEGSPTKFTEETPRKREFATGEWLQKNLRFPTHLNLRYAGAADDDAPVADTVYNQYSFQYESERVGLHGQGSVGQKLVSVTTHTFYVPAGSAMDTVFNTIVEAKNPSTGE